MNNDIVIVGGGSAGWLAASTLKRYFPDKKITLIESKKIPVIGVGESTTAAMKQFINAHLKISDEDFMKGTDAIYKMSVKFNDFYYVNDGGFHYPFGNPYLKDIEWLGIESWDLVKTFNKNLDKNDFIASLFPAYFLFTENKMNDNHDQMLDNFDPLTDLGYHLDARKLGIWLRDHYCLPRGVEHIIADVNDIIADEDGIKFLILDSDQKIQSKFYVDCTGFASVLLKKLNSTYVDLSTKLINNRAWATPINYKNIQNEMIPYTSSTALANGWAWYTPIASRIGNGYCYCDNFVDPEQALNEFKNYLLSEKVPIKLSTSEVDNLPFFELKMNAGYYKDSMIKNVVGIGLSAGFLEPLEGTGLFFITDSLLQLVKVLKRKDLNQWTIDSYNLYHRELFELWTDVLSMIYAQTIRNDSDYWKHIKNKKIDRELVDTPWKTNFHGMKEYRHRFINDHGSLINVFDAYNAIIHGCDLSVDIDDFVIDRWQLWDRKNVDYRQLSLTYKDIFNERKNKWKNVSNRSEHIYKYLKSRNLISYEYN